LSEKKAIKETHQEIKKTLENLLEGANHLNS